MRILGLTSVLSFVIGDHKVAPRLPGVLTIHYVSYMIHSVSLDGYGRLRPLLSPPVAPILVRHRTIYPQAASSPVPRVACAFVPPHRQLMAVQTFGSAWLSAIEDSTL